VLVWACASDFGTSRDFDLLDFQNVEDITRGWSECEVCSRGKKRKRKAFFMEMHALHW
jgi:hypothetical protein